MLGIGYTKLDCNLPFSIYEVKTGEGKSLILVVAAAVLALLEFEVRVACYSKFLSERDFNEFK
jgi:preprotein translocase subunit SecA